MKTDGTPLHGSYFDLLNEKYPDLRRPANARRPHRQPRLARIGRRSTAAGVLLAATTIGFAWLVWTSRLDLPVVPAARSASTVAGVPPRPRVSPPAAATQAALPPAKPAPSTPMGGAGDADRARAVDPPERHSRPPEAPLRARRPAAHGDAPRAEPEAASSPAVDVPPATPSTATPSTPATAEPPGAGPAPSYRPARKLVSPPPEYPLAARQAGEEGTVVVAAEIDETGRVTSTDVVTGRSPALDRAAAETLARWRFEPARRDGRAVASSYRVGFEFALRPPAPVEVGGDVRPPRRLETPLPAYPQEAWAAGVTGDVLVRAVIDERGSVAEVEVLKGLPHGMTEAALEAIRRWKFSPATRDGRPVAVYRNLSVRFET